VHIKSIGLDSHKYKILLLVVSTWSILGWAESRKPASEMIKEASRIQTEKGERVAADFLWKNSEKLSRIEMLHLAKLLIKIKNYKDIIKLSELALAKNPEDAEFLTFQGKAYLESYKDKKTLEKAQESLRAAITANPKFEPPYLILDDYYERQDQLNKTIRKPIRFIQSRRQLFEDLIEHKGPKNLYYAKLCELDTLDGVNDQAIKNCKKAIELDKNDLDSNLFLSQVYKQSDNQKAALEILKSALITHSTSEKAYRGIALFYEEQKNYLEAYAKFKICAEPPYSSDLCLRGLGTTSAQLKKWEESYSAFQKLCKKDRKWSGDVRKASQNAKDMDSPEWEHKFLELSINCNI
jgi:tetratricopeptide (TPR) repeat protein